MGLKRAWTSEDTQKSLRLSVSDLDMAQWRIRWELWFDIARCADCGRDQHASKSRENFPHSRGCRYSWSKKDRPWRDLSWIMKRMLGRPRE